ncbi:hypothetical protein [Streptomyces sp. NBC_00286]|uniref:hypothetical protein n=1 Tax=Streptomyces sp. NBC_00286 TaxID=2975701 RepID=UPI002E2DAFBC|nr:hypothetical protein [Streptomyces sp. NBC_00286]
MGPHIRRHCRTALASALRTPVPALAADASTARIPTGAETLDAPIRCAHCHSSHAPVTVTVPAETAPTCAFDANAQQ